MGFINKFISGGHHIVAYIIINDSIMITPIYYNYIYIYIPILMIINDDIMISLK
jgi:hypothetical protein